jgi:hypothetical protein
MSAGYDLSFGIGKHRSDWQTPLMQSESRFFYSRVQ